MTPLIPAIISLPIRWSNGRQSTGLAAVWPWKCTLLCGANIILEFIITGASVENPANWQEIVLGIYVFILWPLASSYGHYCNRNTRTVDEANSRWPATETSTNHLISLYWARHQAWYRHFALSRKSATPTPKVQVDGKKALPFCKNWMRKWYSVMFSRLFSHGTFGVKIKELSETYQTEFVFPKKKISGLEKSLSRWLLVWTS